MTEFESVTTRGGDTGETSIADGSRRPKDDLLIEVLGDVDELQAALGLVKAALEDIAEKDAVDWIQRCLLRNGGMLAVPLSHPARKKLDIIGDEDVDTLEKWQKEAMDRVSMPRRFITYGGSEAGARADLARAVCRRAERHLVGLIRTRGMRDLAPAQRFLNRLSDYLYVKAREWDAAAGEL